MTDKSLNDKLLKYRESKIKVYPCNNIRASNIGHVCERYLYLSIKNWEDKKPHDAVLQSIFDLGNAMEDYVIKTVKAAGFEIITPTERSWKVENPLITGREDFRIKGDDGKLYPVEVKGLASQEWEKLNFMEDFLNSKKHYVRAYPAQLLIYMWRFEKEKGYFCLANKQTGEIKFIEIEFDYDYVETLLRKAERIYDAIKSSDYSELDTVDDISICDRCDLKHCCTAAHTGIEADFDDGEIAALIARKAEIKEIADEYGDINDKIKAMLSGREKVISGDYIVTISKSERKEYTVKGSTVERLNIKRL